MARASAEFLELLRQLRTELPTEQHVRVVRRVINRAPKGCTETDAAYTLLSKRSARLVLDPEHPEPVQIDSLLHEWAHVLAYNEQLKKKSRDHHDVIWGREYARCWRFFSSL